MMFRETGEKGESRESPSTSLGALSQSKGRSSRASRKFACIVR